MSIRTNYPFPGYNYDLCDVCGGALTWHIETWTQFCHTCRDNERQAQQDHAETIRRALATPEREIERAAIDRLGAPICEVCGAAASQFDTNRVIWICGGCKQ